MLTRGQTKKQAPKKAAHDAQLEHEVKAHLYQQLAELEPMIPSGSGTEMSVKEYSKKKNKFSVSITLKTAYGNIEAKGNNQDVFVAMSQAKQNIIKELDKFYSMISYEDDRPDEVELLRNPWLH